jgi:hypothetical protein
MTASNFVWTINGMHPEFKKHIETAISGRLNKSGIDSTLCHAGPVEVNIAESLPMGHHIDATIICSCGVPRATIAGKPGQNDTWEFAGVRAC